MKRVEFVKTTIVKGVKFNRGTSEEIDSHTAQKLITRGYAKPFVAKKDRGD